MLYVKWFSVCSNCVSLFIVESILGLWGLFWGADSCVWLDHTRFMCGRRNCTGNIGNGKRLATSQHRLELWYIELWLWHHSRWCSRAARERYWLWWWRQVLVWVETTNGRNVSNVRYLNHCVLLPKIVAHVLIRWKMLLIWVVAGIINGIVTVACRIVAVIIILILIIVASFLELFRHGWQRNTFGKVRQWVDESSLLVGVMVKWAALTELALTGIFPELARNGLVVRVDRAKCSFTKILGKWLKTNKN